MSIYSGTLLNSTRRAAQRAYLGSDVHFSEES